MSDLLNQASLVVIPSGYKEDTVYSVVPSDGSGDLSFTRASNGTRINSAGLVEVVAWNLLQYSEDFTNAVYVKYNNITATADQTSAPNGTNTADKIGLSTASTTFPNLAQDAQYIGGQVYTFSVYLKKNTINFGKIRVGGTAFASITNSPIFNLNTGVVVSGTGTIENVGNGWYRCTMTATADTSAAGGFAIDLPDSTGVWSGSSVYNVNDSIFAWGAQLNIGSTAKPYFPTTDRLNVPRLTYQNGGGGCPSLLLEKQSTNIALYSEQFDNAGWIKLNGSVTANIAVSPDGTSNADAFIPNTTSGIHALRSNLFNQSATASHSWFVKANGYTKIAVRESELVGNYATFNLTTGTLISTNQTGSIENLGNGWYRCTLVDTTTGVNAQTSILVLPDSYTSGDPIVVNWSGDGTKGVFAWGAQVELSSYPTSYISTTSASATRVADACSKTGISSLIGQTSGTVFWDIEVETLSASGNENILNIDAGSFGNTIYFSKSAAGSIVAEVYVSGTLQCSFSYNLPSVGRYKIALAYASNDFAFYVNGVSRGTDSSGSVPTCSRLQMGQGALGSSDGKVNQTILFPTRLTNAELASLTTI